MLTTNPAPTTKALAICDSANQQYSMRFSELDDRAKTAMAALDSNGHQSLPLQLRMGEILADAKAALGHGNYLPWVERFLKRKPSWAAAHLRLFSSADTIEAALAWGDEVQHPWSASYSVERRLKIVAAWKNRDQGIQPEPPKKTSKEAIAELEQEIADLKLKIADYLEEIDDLRFRAPPRCESCGGPQVWPDA